MILTGWKEISNHLRYGVRTLQRWEGRGLPVKRVNQSPRNPVVADSEDLDAWILRGMQLPPGAPPDLLKNRQRALELRRVVQEHKKEFQIRVRDFRKQVEEHQAKTRKQTNRDSAGVR